MLGAAGSGLAGQDQLAAIECAADETNGCLG